MQTRFLFSTLLLFQVITSAAQINSNKDYLEISAGPAFPVAEYARKEITNSASGFAKAGEFLKVSYIHYIRSLPKNFGLAATIHGQRNAIDHRAFENALSQADFYTTPFATSDPNQPAPQYPSRQYGNWSVEKNSWWFGSLQLGGHTRFSPTSTSNLLFTIKVMMGILYASAPALNGKSISDTVVVHANQTSSSALGFLYSLNGGLNYRLNKNISLITGVEYLGTNTMRFKNITSSFSATHYSNGTPTSAAMQTVRGEGRQKIQSMNWNLGIELSL